ncbi:hypothetical protein [uncultured Shewanella sp.]|nr:hypothetical protein [uncultured Shewanella sp.]
MVKLSIAAFSLFIIISLGNRLGYRLKIQALLALSQILHFKFTELVMATR